MATDTRESKQRQLPSVTVHALEERENVQYNHPITTATLLSVKLCHDLITLIGYSETWGFVIVDRKARAVLYGFPDKPVNVSLGPCTQRETTSGWEICENENHDLVIFTPTDWKKACWFRANDISTAIKKDDQSNVFPHHPADRDGGYSKCEWLADMKLLTSSSQLVHLSASNLERALHHHSISPSNPSSLKISLAVRTASLRPNTSTGMLVTFAESTKPARNGLPFQKTSPHTRIEANGNKVKRTHQWTWFRTKEHCTFCRAAKMTLVLHPKPGHCFVVANHHCCPLQQRKTKKATGVAPL